MKPAVEPGDLCRTSVARACQGCRLVRHCVWVKEVDSTQEQARRLARIHGCGVLVVADQQTRGHGRLGRSWFSPSGGLWLSLVLEPRRPRREWPLLTSIAALALRDALQQETGLTCGIKWPNDLFCRGRKIAGILAESGREDWAALGIGLNVAQDAHAFPAELRRHATSLRMECGRSPARDRLLAALLAHLDSWIGRFEDDGPPAVRTALRQASLLIGRIVSIGRAWPADGADGITVDAGGVAGENSSRRESWRGRVVDVGILGEMVLEIQDPADPGERGVARRMLMSAGEVLSIDPPLG